MRRHLLLEPLPAGSTAPPHDLWPGSASTDDGWSRKQGPPPRALPIARRRFLLMPAAGLLRPVFGHGIAPQRRPAITHLRLASSTPFLDLSNYWRVHALPMPARVLARPHPAWWRRSGCLPDRWQAWLELPSGAAILVSYSGVRHCAGDSNGALFMPARVIADALMSEALPAGSRWPA